jgi:hypothetical protein
MYGAPSYYQKSYGYGMPMSGYKSYPSYGMSHYRTYGHIWKRSADAEPEAEANAEAEPEAEPTFYKYGAPSYYQRSYNPNFAMRSYRYGMPMSMSSYRSYPSYGMMNYGYGMPMSGDRSFPSYGMSFPTYGILTRSADAEPESEAEAEARQHGYVGGHENRRYNKNYGYGHRYNSRYGYGIYDESPIGYSTTGLYNGKTVIAEKDITVMDGM